ncbi:MAG TPA: substrate-binding domain-containing protein [Actinomycetes bacterium]|jgi:phosphate transport system substrate-binding protein|nr:substrate-binding domain-containing protein [Actinomycetes bacterium]
MNRPSAIAVALLLVLLAAVGGASPAAATYTQIEGSGSTWSEVILDQWISDVDALGMKVTYNGGGSSQGRKNFAQYVTDFGISEIPFQGTDEYGQSDTSNGRPYAYLPIVAGGTSFTYQVRVAGKLVRDLRLSGGTIAKIFTNQIVNWNDPAITKDNNGHALPSLPITPVVRSDGSGTTAQFTTWLDKQYPSDWRPFFGRSGLTSYFPRKGRAIAAAGSDQVMNTIAGAAGNGTIGYIEYSYPLNKHYPVVKLLNKAGFFVQPTQYNVAVALTHARINSDPASKDYLTQILDDVYAAPEPQAYPLSSYSYMILPTGADDRRMTTSKRQTLVDFMFYSLCEGQSKAGAYGYSPLPLNLVAAGFTQLTKLGQADPGVDIAHRDATRCNNPTFVKGDLTRNHLAEIAPSPAACDKVGAGPCGAVPEATTSGSGATTTTTAGPRTAAAGSAGSAGGSARGAAGSSGAAAGSGSGQAGTVDPETGATVGTTSLTGAQPVAGQAASDAVPVELGAARSPEGTNVFGVLAVIELVALVLAPGLVTLAIRRRRARPGAAP